jgi:hypothetical protein
MDQEVRRLLDEQAIRGVLARYCRGVDRMDRELVRSCYHPDATESHGSFQGTLDEYLDWVWRLLGRYDSTFHFLGNVLVEPVDDDRARCEAYGIAFHRTASGHAVGNLVTGFRYLDRFERRGGDWRIVHRTALTEWSRVDAPELQWPLPPGMPTGRRDRTDLVYEPW